MITINSNNFGGSIVTLKDFQSNGLCVLNGKIIVNPSHPAYIAASRLELDLPSNFAMSKSAMSTAILVSNSPVFRDGTVLHCWIENKKICIEKLTLWDSFGNYEIYINSCFVTRGYHGVFTDTITKYVYVQNPMNEFILGKQNYVETDNYVSFMASFPVFPNNINNGQGPFSLQFTDFAIDVNVEIPIIVTDFASRNMTGGKFVIGTFENGSLTFSYPHNTSPMGGNSSFFYFFAVRDKTNFT